jgi:FOG: Ankyrin repeat
LLKYKDLDINKAIIDIGRSQASDKTGFWHGWTALHFVCKYNLLKILKDLLKHKTNKIEDLDPNKTNSYGETALHLACENNNLEIVKELLKHPDIKINIQDKFGHTPLYKACTYKNVRIVKELLSRKDIDIHKSDKHGLTPFHYSCEQKLVEIVTIFLEKEGIDVNETVNTDDAEGWYQDWTPLHFACRYIPNLKIVKTLKENVSSQQKELSDFEQYVKFIGERYSMRIVEEEQNVREERVKKLRYIETVKKLLKHGNININSITKFEDKTPLSIAKESNCSEVIKVITQT